MRNGLNLRWAEVEEVEPLAQMWRAAWRSKGSSRLPQIFSLQLERQTIPTRRGNSWQLRDIPAEKGSPS